MTYNLLRKKPTNVSFQKTKQTLGVCFLFYFIFSCLPVAVFFFVPTDFSCFHELAMD